MKPIDMRVISIYLFAAAAVVASARYRDSVYSFGGSSDDADDDGDMYSFGFRKSDDQDDNDDYDRRDNKFGSDDDDNDDGLDPRSDKTGYLSVDSTIRNALIYRDDETGDTDLESIKQSYKPTNDMRGIYVDFIYDPNFYLELSVVKHMLDDILDRNNNTPYYYDFERLPGSYRVTVGIENLILLDESIISIKPKLLKDILYNENIFLRIYDFLYAFFQVTVRDSSRIPEYDRSINFKAYSQRFGDMLKLTDHQSKTVCRTDELYGVNDGRLCVRADHGYIERAGFKHPETEHYWKTILSRIAEFMNVMLTNTIRVDANSNHDDCYEILLRPELDVRAVLLFPHRAVKSALVDERLEFSLKNRMRIIDDIILFKHRVMHALGVGHKYVTPSIMTFYNKPWQTKNLFYIMPEDYESLSQCYVDSGAWYVPTTYETRIPNKRVSKRYVKSDARDATALLNLFVGNFERFVSTYKRVR